MGQILPERGHPFRVYIHKVKDVVIAGLNLAAYIAISFCNTAKYLSRHINF